MALRPPLSIREPLKQLSEKLRRLAFLAPQDVQAVDQMVESQIAYRMQQITRSAAQRIKRSSKSA